MAAKAPAAPPPAPDENEMALVRTTVGSEDQARALARALIDERAACCVHLQRIESVYEWDGATTQEPEWLVEARVPAALAEDTWVRMMKGHPYQVPLAEIIRDVRVNGAYAQWARQVTGLAD